jgi:hypothetical protein
MLKRCTSDEHPRKASDELDPRRAPAGLPGGKWGAQWAPRLVVFLLGWGRPKPIAGRYCSLPEIEACGRHWLPAACESAAQLRDRAPNFATGTGCPASDEHESARSHAPP